MRSYLFILIISFYNLTSAQTYKGKLINEKGLPVPNAYVINLNQHFYTFSNKDGKFELNYKDGDSIEIRHLSYKIRKVFSVKKNIHLQSKSTILKEISIKSKKTIPLFIGNYKKKALINIGIGEDYAFKIKNSYKREVVVQEVEIPIKFVKGVKTIQGNFFISFSRVNKDGGVGEVFSKEDLSFRVDSTLKSKKIIIPLKKGVILPIENFYILIRRTVENKNIDFTNYKIQTNPYLYMNPKGEEGDSYYRKFNSSKWMPFKKNIHSMVPNVAIKLKVSYL